MARATGITLKGLQEAQAANLKIIAALKPGGAVGKATQLMTVKAFRWVVTMTHVGETGFLRTSRRMDVQELEGIIYTASSLNKFGQNPKGYDVPEQARGGTHQTYVNFMATQALAVGRLGIITMLRELP